MTPSESSQASTTSPPPTTAACRPQFLDELQDPNWPRVDEDALSGLELPVRLTHGSESPATFPAVIDRLVELMPRASRETIEGAAHVPQLTAPERYVEVTRRALQSAAA